MGRALKRLQKVQLDRPQEKFNLPFVATDFVLTTIPELAGEYIYNLRLAYSSYKYLHIPLTALKLFILTKTGDIITAYQNTHIPTDLIKELILVRPDDFATGTIYFQCILSNVQDTPIVDCYREQLVLITTASDTIQFPFPTYNIRLAIKVNSANWDFTLNTYPYRSINFVHRLDTGAGIVATELNNYYTHNDVGGSGVVTDPKHPFPTWRTTLYIKNNHASTATFQILLYSWLGRTIR